ncbi:MAG: pyruvate formate lyase family protein [Lentisphaerota bacterium]
MNELKLTARVELLLQEMRDAAKQNGRQLLNRSEQQFYASCRYAAAVACSNEPEIIRRADMLERFAREYPIKLHPLEPIAGSQRFRSPAMMNYYTEAQLTGLPINGNIGHIVVNYALLLEYGIDGMAERIRNMMVTGVNREAMLRALEAFRVFVCRHDNAVCSRIASTAPSTFHEALQMVWFTQIFLHAEGNGAAVSFGRFDQYLWRFLEADLAHGSIDLENAFELLCCFFIKTCEGDESQNLVVGGEAPAGGANGENLLSLLVLRAMAQLQIWQPSISVRIGPYTSEEFWKEALNLCSTGTGMPSFFNEPVVTAGLEALDVPPERASDWGIVGCYEAAPQGDSYPLTVAGNVVLPTWLELFLGEPEADVETFALFIQHFKTFAKTVYEQENLPNFQQRWNGMRQNNASPFESICVSGCIESGKAVEEGGAMFNFFGVNVLGIGTLIDSLLVIDALVFRDKTITYNTLREQLRQNFTDDKLLQDCRHLPGKFGSDTPESNLLAHDLSGFIADLILTRQLENGVRPYPGLFSFGADIGLQIPATPDGRRDHDFISYGCGPGAFLPPGSPTSILNAVALLEHSRFACGNPLTLALNREDVRDERGQAALRQLIEGYFRQGGFHLHFNLAGPDELLEARRQPELYGDLIVRISGLSAAFVSLNERWQNAIIERTAKGI